MWKRHWRGSRENCVEKILNRFILNISLLQGTDTKLRCNAVWYNEDVPAEMLLAQLRALVRQMENGYFDNFDRNSTAQMRGK
jgi:hypothetical protein